jgi:hypothetical protein
MKSSHNGNIGQGQNPEKMGKDWVSCFLLQLSDYALRQAMS